MGPKKDTKKAGTKIENGAGAINIDDPINTDTWKCVVVMAVEKTKSDAFVLKEFLKESLKKRRREVCVIDHDTLITEIINYFASGELPYKYSFLQNFSSIFQEAVGYVSQKMEIPLLLFVKIVKAFLFYLREESLVIIKKLKTGTPDPIKDMMERGTTYDTADSKRLDVSKKNESRLVVRPPSYTKEDTKLLKREEGIKFSERIDDAPVNAYFNLYVLLTGFYQPEFPLELLKGGIPLHGVFCIDSSKLEIKEETLSSNSKLQKRISEADIQNFWSVFLKVIWEPENTNYFKNTIFQVYKPEKFRCDIKKFPEFIFREISYLMYDMSDLKRQMDNYIDHIILRNVSLREVEYFETPAEIDTLPGECVSVPVMLQFMMDMLSIKKPQVPQNSSMSSSTSTLGEVEEIAISSTITMHDPNRSWCRELEERGDYNLLQACLKIKELDERYDMCDKNTSGTDSPKEYTKSLATDSTESLCGFHPRECGKNIAEALSRLDSGFAPFWKRYRKMKTTFSVDFYLYPLFLMKVFCRYQNKNPVVPTTSSSVTEKNSYHEIDDDDVAQTPNQRYTVTEGSRSILRSIPNRVTKISRNFFCPPEYKIVTSDKLKASSAPEFRVTPSLRIENIIASEIFSKEISKNPYEVVKGFADEGVFSNTDDFDFLEFLNKPKLLEKEREYWNNYNCVDHAYSFLDDTIFFILHKRTGAKNALHETFNESLTTPVGLRDFYQFVSEDESEWLKLQEELHHIAVFLSNKIVESDSFKNIADSEFWLYESIKYQYFNEVKERTSYCQELISEPSSFDKLTQRFKVGNLKKTLATEEFEGYDLDKMVQFSGLKTIYYANDCHVVVQLVEQLYGNQDLGVHVTAGSHSLHLYSFVCPVPHTIEPFTFHVSYKNGVVVAFGRRYLEIIEEVEEPLESTTTVKGKRNSSDSREPVLKRQISKIIKDEDFMYDMSASIPNGLVVKAVRKLGKPCYIKQYYVAKYEDTAKLENSRLFLPNGNIVKMMSNGTFEVLKIDTTIITAHFSDLIKDAESGKHHLKRCKVASGQGFDKVYEDGKMTSSNRYQIFQNTDLETKQVYFRRRDGTNYVLRNDGTFCMQFKDGTRLSSTLLTEPEVLENPYKTDSMFEESSLKDIYPRIRFEEVEIDIEGEYKFVELEITAEHPDYATVVYNTKTQIWRILLPHDSAITIEPEGCYFVDIDKQTKLRLKDDVVEMERFSQNGDLLSVFTADTSVFTKPEETAYCRLKDTTGKTFILDKDSNYHVVDSEDSSSEEMLKEESEESQLIASTDLQSCPSTETHNSRTLIRESKYFAVKRDLTGMELLHKDDVRKELGEREKGCLVYTSTIPEIGTRCFVEISPVPVKKLKKWEVETILPDPKYNPNPTPKQISTTYGVPPSWMHPFPKKKSKFTIPTPLSCRVFVETKKTDLTIPIGTIGSLNIEVEDPGPPQYSKIPLKETLEVIKKLTDDDQDILKEMYHQAVLSMIQEKKKRIPVNSKKLEHYLEISKYYVEQREYHKNCIRYNIVPNYFQHPAGMSWLILNDILLNTKLPEPQPTIETPVQVTVAPRKEVKIEGREFSNEEIEYNMPLSPGRSFSELSYNPSVTSYTAPAKLRADGVCGGEVPEIRTYASSPAIRFHETEPNFLDTEAKELDVGVCGFLDKDLEKIEMEDIRKSVMTSLEDLMRLGLV